MRPLATGLVVSVPTDCVLASSPENDFFVLGITLKTWWGLCFTTTLTLLNSHKTLTTSTYSWSACRRRASSLNASYDTSLYLAYQVGRYHMTRFSVYWGGMGWAIPLYAEFSTQTPQPESPTAASRDMLLHVYLSPTAPDRWEGYLLSTTHLVLAYIARRHGCRDRIRTYDFTGYEPGLLTTASLCDIIRASCM